MERKFIKVLLVEDDEDDYLIVKDLLEEIQDTSYRLIWVQNYTEAQETIEQKNFDVLLVDYRLRKRTGLDLLKELNGKSKKMPVIFLTGMSDRRVDLAAMQAGAADFLVKNQLDANLLERAIRYAMERTRLLNTLNELATRDELTGLYNRREMDRFLDKELERFQRNNHPVSLILLDIDHFKNVNDSFGHHVGDQVLKQLSKMISNITRSVDFVIRYGGEEFSIVLPDTPGKDAFKVAERLRKNVADNDLICVLDDGTKENISITISLGVAELPNDVITKKALLIAADQALYASKEQGRNQTVAYQSIDLKQAQ